jgi:single-strand DNA-binding protein
MNQVLLIGRVGKDPTCKTVGSKNTKIAELSIATSKNIGNYQNPNWVSTWHNIKCWSKQAEFAENNIRKGDEVFVSGELEVQQWDGKDGTKQYRTSIVADTVRVTKVAEAKEGQGQHQDYQQAPQQQNSRGGGSNQSNRQQQQYPEQW